MIINYTENIIANKNKKEKDYWVGKFSTGFEKSSFPPNIMRHSKQDCKMESLQFEFSENLRDKLNHISNHSEHGLNLLLVTAVSAVLARYCGDNNITIGVPVYRQNTLDQLVNSILPLKTRIDDDGSFKDLLQTIRNEVTEACRHQNYPMSVLMDNLNLAYESDSEFPLFDVLVMLENVHDASYIKGLNVNVIFSFRKNSDSISGLVKFNSFLYHGSTIERIKNNIIAFMENAVENPSEPLKSLSIISSGEINLLNRFRNSMSANYTECTLIDIIEKNSIEFADKIAAECEEKNYTYSQLQKRSNKIANYLIQDYKIQEEEIIAVVMDRGIEYAAVVLGIWKAGGAYVPLEYTYPSERIKSIIEEAKIKVVFTEEKFVNLQDELFKDPNGFNEYVFIDSNRVCGSRRDRLRQDLSGFDEVLPPGYKGIKSINQLAYVIYTSGSTGKPKGAMVEHLGMINHINIKINDLNLDSSSVVAQNASACFDISVWQFFSAFVAGGKTVIYPSEEVLNPVQFIEKIVKDQITVLEVVPSYLSILLESIELKEKKLGSLKYIVVTGEELKSKLVKEWFSKIENVRMVNAYGPTEASDDITHYTMDEFPKRDIIPIGTPLSNFNIYIVDKYMNFCPIGVKGEILVSGIGVGRGYLNNAEKTDQVFSIDPFRKEKTRLYRTGDVGYWLEDGNICFVGRVDNQVKIRGFRIELGEIERNLIEHPSVKQAVVNDMADENNNKFLCAYIVKSSNDSDVDDVKGFLGKRLPQYMIPSCFVYLDHIPLNSNGKVDRRALPYPVVNEAEDSQNTEIIQSYTENILVEIIKEVFKGQRFSPHTSFFEMGIDSIKSMQIIARLQKYNLKAEIKDILNYPNIKSLSRHVKLNYNVSFQGMVEGYVELTPIQKWFFENDFKDPNHYNQAFMLYRREGFDRDIVIRSFEEIIKHHDALRMVFQGKGSNVAQKNRGNEGEMLHFEIFNIKNDKDIKAEIKSKADGIHENCDLKKGPLVRLGLFMTEMDGHYLLISIHHLVIDGVSWRILLEDFSKAYGCLSKGETVNFQSKTDSFRDWALRLKTLANSGGLAEEVEFWKEMESIEIDVLKKDFTIPEEEKILKNMDVIEGVLGIEETKGIIYNTCQFFNTDMNVVLLSALGLAIKEWCGNERILIDLEGHGREPLFEDVNVSRTVGWFTSLFPVVIQTMQGTILENINHVKMTTGMVPNKGMTFGVLKYLSDNNNIGHNKRGCSGEILFNYLGQFDDVERYGEFDIYDMNMGDLKKGMFIGNVISPHNRNLYTLEISGEVVNGKLVLSTAYNRLEYKRETIQKLVDLYLSKILELADLAQNLKALDYYEASSAQKRLYLLQQFDKESTQYNMPLVLEVNGKLDVQKIKSIFQKLSVRHEAFRTSFAMLKDEIYQKISQNSKLCFSFMEIEKDQLESEIKGFIMPFDLEHGQLLRVKVIRINENQHYLMLDMHHIISDGFSMEILINEFIDLYRGIQLEELELQYKDFIKIQNTLQYKKRLEIQGKYWLEKFSREISETTIAYDYPIENLKNNDCHIINFEFNFNKIKKLRNLAIYSEATLNMVMFTVYCVLLHKLTGQQNIIVGVVTSGRNDAMTENIIGMFVNTLPIKIFIEENHSFMEVLHQVRKNLLEAYENQDYPFEELVQKLNVKRNPNRNPLFTTMFSQQNINMDLVKVEDLSFKRYELGGTKSKFDITLSVTEGDETIFFELEYCSELFKESSMKQFIQRYDKITEAVMLSSDILIKDIKILDIEEENRIVSEIEAFQDSLLIDVDF